MSDVWTALVSAGGVLAGTVAGGVITLKVNERQRRDDRAAREADREHEGEAARGSFQADTLAELQLALHRFGDAVGRVFDAASDREERTGEPTFGEPDIYDNDLARAARELGGVVTLLLSRVSDDQARDLVKDAYDSWRGVVSAPSRAAAFEGMTESVDLTERALDVVGELLRGGPRPTGDYRRVLDDHVAARGIE